MDLFVIRNEFDFENHYYVVDETKLKEKTKFIDDYTGYFRLDEESEKHALNAYHKGSDDIWEVILGDESDFFIAEIKEKLD